MREMSFEFEDTIEVESSSRCSGTNSTMNFILIAVGAIVVLLFIALVAVALSPSKSHDDHDHTSTPSPAPTPVWSPGEVDDEDDDNAYRLTRVAVPLSYGLELTPNFETFFFKGKASVQVHFLETLSNLTMNAAELTFSSVVLESEDGQSSPVTWEFDEKHETVTLALKTPVVENDIVTLKFEYEGILNDQMRGFYRSFYHDNEGKIHWLASTQFQATDARRAFPSFDEPLFKATFDLTMNVPRAMMALSNMPQESRIELNDGVDQVKFQTTLKMSTYLLCFVVGEFDSVSSTWKTEGEGETKERPVTVYTLPGLSDQGIFARDVAVRALKYYEDTFQIEYPLPKLDMIAIPDFSAGAMENWGLVTYRQVDLLFDPKTASASSEQRVAIVVAHELAHQWFGNLVTADWWGNLWLHESLATYFEHDCINNLYPEWKMREQMIIAQRTALYRDSLRTSHPVAWNPNTPDTISEMFDSITYEKGGSVLLMTEDYMGREPFFNGLRFYLNAHAYSNANSGDFWAAMDIQIDSSAPTPPPTAFFPSHSPSPSPSPFLVSPSPSPSPFVGEDVLSFSPSPSPSPVMGGGEADTPTPSPSPVKVDPVFPTPSPSLVPTPVVNPSPFPSFVKPSPTPFFDKPFPSPTPMQERETRKIGRQETEEKMVLPSVVMNKWTFEAGVPLLSVSSSAISQERFLNLEARKTKQTGDNSPWWVPVRYRLDSKDSSDFILINSSSTDFNWQDNGQDSWVKLNSGQQGLFRVNYEDQTWENIRNALSDNLDTLPELDRSGLLNDAMVLAKEDKLSYTVALSLLKSILEKDLSYLVWDGALTEMYAVGYLLRDKYCYASYEEFMQKIITNALSQLSPVAPTAPPNTPHTASLLRAQLFSAGVHFKSPELLRECLEMFWGFVNDNTPIDPDYRQGAYTGAVMAGDRKEYDQVRAMYMNETDAVETVRLLRALPATTRRPLIQSTLEALLDPTIIRPQNQRSVFSGISANEVGEPLGWDFYRNNFAVFNQRGLGGGGLKYVTRYFSTERRLDEVIEFFTENKPEGGEMALQASIETINFNIAWIASNADEVCSWLLNEEKEQK